jgi:cell division protease FtsH
LGEEIAHRREYSETTAREIDEEVKSILDEAYQRAAASLQKYREELDRIAEVLLQKEEITDQEVLDLIGVVPDKLPVFAADGRMASETNNPLR